MVAPGNWPRLYRRIAGQGQWLTVNAELTDSPQAEISPFKRSLPAFLAGFFFAQTLRPNAGRSPNPTGMLRSHMMQEPLFQGENAWP